MSSEFNHIDDFFRKKEEESAASYTHQEQHWQQMKDILTTSGHSSDTNANHRFRNFSWFIAALLILATGIWILAKEESHTTSKTNTSATIIVHDSLPMRDTFLLYRSIEPGKFDTIKLKIPARVLPMGTRLIPKKDSVNLLHISPVLFSNQEAYHSFFQSLEKPFETFIIDNEKDTTLICKEGTAISIPAGTFVSLIGTSSSQVTFRIREFYDIADIVAHKLTTSSFSEPLVTGGMIYMEALSNSEELKMKKGSAIKVTMPTEKFDSQMQLFTDISAASQRILEVSDANQEIDTTTLLRGINWTAMGQQQFLYEPPEKLVNVLDLTNSPSKVTGKKTQSIAHFKIPYSAPGSTAELKKQLEARYGGLYTEIKVKRQHKPITIFNFYTGKKYRRNESDPFVGDTISIPLKVASQLKLINSHDSLRFEENYLKTLENQIKLHEAYLKDYSQRKQYNFSITSLGWINCDRFLKSQQQKVPFMVNTGKGFEDIYFESFLIFRDFNGIMGGTWQNGKITFPNIPVGQKVSTVCIGVKDGKAYYAIKDFQVSNDEVSLEMTETTPDAFREQLKRFGTVKGE
jgi:hypothetical protein